VPVIFRKRDLFLFVMALSLGSPTLAQQFGIGATYGWVNDVTHEWALDNFHPRDWETWFDARLEDNVLTRASFGSISTAGANVGSSAIVSGSPVTIPYYKTDIGYVTLDASYVFRVGPFNSGLFGGIGGYRINPDPISASLDTVTEPEETVFGWNVGVDGDLHLYRGLAAVGRVTFHGILSENRRYLLVTSIGAVYRF
jgi:hypothetical protein